MLKKKKTVLGIHNFKWFYIMVKPSCGDLQKTFGMIFLSFSDFAYCNSVISIYSYNYNVILYLIVSVLAYHY